MVDVHRRCDRLRPKGHWYELFPIERHDKRITLLVSRDRKVHSVSGPSITGVDLTLFLEKHTDETGSALGHHPPLLHIPGSDWRSASHLSA